MRDDRRESKVGKYEGMQSKAKNGVKKCIMDARLLINLVPDNIGYYFRVKAYIAKN